MCQTDMDRKLLMNFLQDLKAHRTYLSVQIARHRGEPVDVDVNEPLGFSSTKCFNSFVLKSYLQFLDHPKEHDIKYFEDRLAITEKLIADLMAYLLEVA